MRFVKQHSPEARTPSRFAIDFSASTDRAIQSGKDDADINVMMRRFGVTGNLPPVNAQPFYGDFTGVEDYRTALDRVRDADNAFAALSADVRKRFDNSPAQLWDYLHGEMTDERRAEARSLGLILPEPPPPPVQRVEVVNHPPAPGPGGAASPA